MARVRLMQYDDGSQAFQWGEAGEPYEFVPGDDDSTAVAFAKAVNEGVENGDEIEGDAAQAVAEVLKSGEPMWNSERSFNDWRNDLCAQLPASNYAVADGGSESGTYYYVDDIALDGSKVLICGCEKGEMKRWVALVTTVGDDPLLSGRTTWVEVEEQFVAKAGRQFSNRNFDAMRAAHDALARLIAAGETERTPKEQKDEDDQPEVAKATGPEMSYTIQKADGAMRYTLGPLYAPTRKDAHGEFVDDEILHKSLHEFVRDSAENGRRINLQHGDKGDIQVGEWVEAVRWPYDHVIKMSNPATGEEHEVEMPAGTVYLGVVWDEEYWDVAKNAPKGLNGYSLGGRAVKVKTDDSETLKDMGYKVRKTAEAVAPAPAPVKVEEDTEAALEIVKRDATLQERSARLEADAEESRSLLRRTLDVLEKTAEAPKPETHIHLPEQNVTINDGGSVVDDLLAPDPPE